MPNREAERSLEPEFVDPVPIEDDSFFGGTHASSAEFGRRVDSYYQKLAAEQRQNWLNAIKAAAQAAKTEEALLNLIAWVDEHAQRSEIEV